MNSMYTHSWPAFCNMTRLSLILLASLATCVAAEPQPRPDVQFRATVQDVAPLTGFSGTVILVDTDPQYVLTLRLVAVNGTTNLVAGTIVRFAVHSPSKIFAGQPGKGRTYDFELDRKEEGGMATYSGLRLRKPAANQGASLDAGRAVPFAFGRLWPGASEL